MDSIKRVNNIPKDVIKETPVVVANPILIKKEIPLLYKIILAIVTALFIGASFLDFYFYKKSSQVNEAISKTSQLKDTIERVGKLMDLPTGEEPTFATVEDPTKLQNQPFFAKAKKGDQVLVYSVARKVILYDPVANKILEVAPLNPANTTQNTPQTPPTTSLRPKH